MSETWIVVGLGNPGPTYASTRHNAGAMVVESLAERAGARLRGHRRSNADVAEVRLGPPPGVRAILARPRTYVNLSGAPVAALLGYFSVPVDRLLVVHDELDLPYGTIRLKRGGSDGGHNGLKSVRSALGTGDFHRLRFGIGRPPGRTDPAVFVLKPFLPAERSDLTVHLERAADAAEAVLLQGLTYAQNHFNG